MFKKILIVSAVLISLLAHSPHILADSHEVIRPMTNKEYAEKRVSEVWDETQWKHFEDLINRESHWNDKAQNPKSSAYGLGQLLDSTWDDVDCVKTDNGHEQIDCTITYVKNRYGTPAKAIMFHNKKNWY